jgi:hypothetical protein
MVVRRPLHLGSGDVQSAGVAGHVEALDQDRVHLVAPIGQVLAECGLTQAGVQQHECLLDLADLG